MRKFYVLLILMLGYDMVAGQEATSNYILPYRTQTRMLQIMQLPQVGSADSTLVRSPGGWVGTRPFPNWVRLEGKPSVFPSNIGLVQGLQAVLDGKANSSDLSGYLPSTYAPSWASVTGKPTTFSPSAHTHAVSDVTGLQGILDAKLPSTYIPTWSSVSGKPSVYPSNVASVSGLQAQLDGKQPVGNYLTTSYVPTYAALPDKPTIPAAQIQSDWSQTNTASADFIKNKPTITGPQSYFNVAGSIPRPGKVLVDRIAVTSGTMTINISSAGFTTTSGMIIRADVERAGTANIDAVTCKVRSFTATQVVIDFYQPVTIVLGGLGMQLLNTFANTWVHLRVEGN